MLRTTAGKLALAQALPEEMRAEAASLELDKNGMEALLHRLAEKHPEKYRESLQALSRLGYHSAYLTGGFSFGPEHLRTPLSVLKMKQALAARVEQIAGDPRLSDSDKERRILEETLAQIQPLEKAVVAASEAEDNPLAGQAKSGARGKATNLKSLRGADLLYVDHKDRPISIPVLRSISQGLTPAEYYAGTFGARKGVVDVKMGTPDSSYLGKQMIQTTHRLLVTRHDADDPARHAEQGLPVDTDDADNEGALLAFPAGGYSRNTVLRPKVLAHLREQGIRRIVVRSPLTGGPEEGGVYGRDVGVRERGGIAPVGDFVGISASQALTEPLSQSALSSKHSGGVAGATAGGVSGFALVNALIQVPKTFPGGAAHARKDGRVDGVEAAPQGGHYVTVQGERHYVAAGCPLKVKVGDVVEAGDVLSAGTPSPALLGRYNGIGLGRRYFTQAFRQAYKDAGITVHRRNVELLARGLIDHVRLAEEHGPYVPGDLVSYSRLEHAWTLREGHEKLSPARAIGRYLERPVLHYSIGTRLQPSMAKELAAFGVKEVLAHKEPPPFEAEMVRGMENLSHDPDWMARFLGAYQEKNLLSAVHRGDVSDEAGTSYVPGLARAVEFGQKGPVRSWKPTSILQQ